MKLYVVPAALEPVTLATLRTLYPSVSWANADAGGPDAAALEHIGGSIAPPQPACDPLCEYIAWEAGGWAVLPLLFVAPGEGSGGA